MSGTALPGYMFVEHKNGERVPLLSENDGLRDGRVEMLPRLWHHKFVNMRGTEFRLRGVQKQSGRLVHQEWLCYVLER